MMTIGCGIIESVWNRRKSFLYGNGSAFDVSHTNPILECDVNGTMYLITTSRNPFTNGLFFY